MAQAIRIHFLKPFEDVSEGILHISKKDVIRTVTNPLKKQVIEIENLKVLLFLQKESNSATYLLIMGQYENNTLIVPWTCFRLLPELVSRVENKEPILLLQQLVHNFGSLITIGAREDKFFFRETVSVPKSDTPMNIVQFKLPPNSQFITSMYIKPQMQLGIVKCAIVFLILLQPYIAWLESKTSISIASQTYDVFIAYKRSTGKSFASYLKECLTEEGYRAFLDIIDIPKEFEGTDKWFEVRDQAIRNSKRFLLIITVAIESSKEVAKELIFARGIKGMKFIYLKHDMGNPHIAIEYGNEIVDLSEGNQVSFSTEDDLARRVLQILGESTI